MGKYSRLYRLRIVTERLAMMSPSEITYFLKVAAHHVLIWCNEADIVDALRKECYSQKGSNPALLEARCILTEELAKHCQPGINRKKVVRWNGNRIKPLRF